MLRLLTLLGLVVQLVFVCAPCAALGDELGSLPPGLQAAVIDKILSFDRTVGDKVRRILVVYGDGLGQQIAVEMASALQGQGMPAKSVSVADLQGEPTPAAVYLASPAGLDKVQKYCIAAKVLSMTQEVELVKSGQIAVAVAPSKDRTLDIWIHLGRSRSESQDLAAELLHVARVVQ